GKSRMTRVERSCSAASALSRRVASLIVPDCFHCAMSCESEAGAVWPAGTLSSTYTGPDADADGFGSDSACGCAGASVDPEHAARNISALPKTRPRALRATFAGDFMLLSSFEK